MSFRRVSVRYQTLDLQILCSKALSLGQRNSEESLATTRLTYDTCPTYCLDQQCQKGHMSKQNKKDSKFELGMKKERMMFYRLVTSVGIPVRNRTQCSGFRSWENVLENITFNEQILIMLYQTPRWQRLRR